MAPSLTPGEYAIAIDAKGFKQAQRKGITLDVDQSANLDFALEFGSSAETSGGHRSPIQREWRTVGDY
jgi:hypothetical protein